LKILGYGERWLELDREILNPFEEQEARRRYLGRKSSFVVALGTDQGKRTVEFDSRFVSVTFFDETGRDFLLYNFKLMPDGRLFLSEAIHSGYATPRDRERTEMHHFAFKPDGVYFASHHDERTGLLTEKTGTADTAPNWEEYPAFGQYERLLDVERLARSPPSVGKPRG
jgi:hypothetical protein